jgi:Flp pilus assembly protein TadG
MIQKLTRSRGGAIYVEFLIAIIPMLTLFWGMMQLNGLLLADLVTRHAAVNAVRAAIVCGSQAKDLGGTAHAQDGSALGNPGGCAYEAAKKTLSAVQSFGTPPIFTVRVEGASKSGNGPVTVAVNSVYRCRVPLVAGIVCGYLPGAPDDLSFRIISREATLPNQGATYDM